MKILNNAYGLGVIIKALLKVNPYKKIISQAKAAGDFEQERACILEACQIWSSAILEGLDTKVNVINPENLPKDGPVVFICNHQSYADILTFLYTIKNHQIGFLAKDTLQKVRLLGGWITRIRGIFMRRGDSRASLETIKEGANYLSQGFSLVIFPEGTRSRGGEMKEFKAGSFKLATKAKVPIVPITIEGAYKVYEKDGIVTKGQTINFMVHAPIDTASMDRHQLALLPAQVEETVRSGLDLLLSQA